MSTIIDELIIQLSLDPSKFSESERKSLEDFRRTKEAFGTYGKDIENQTMKMSDAFSVAKEGILGIFGAVIGGQFTNFLAGINHADAVTGRWANTIGTSVENLSIWQNMIQRVGGSAEEATSSMSALQTMINNVRSGNGMFDNPFGSLLNKIGGFQGKNADQIMRELQAYYSEQINSGKMKPDQAATELSWVPGMNQSMINLMLSDMKKVEEEAKAIGAATRESAEAAQSLADSWSKLGQAITEKGRHALVFLAPFLKEMMDAGTKDLSDKHPLNWNQYPAQSWWDTIKGGIGWSHPTTSATTPSAALPQAPGAPSPSGGRASAADREAWVRSFAATLGIDPDTAMRVSMSEGFRGFQSGIAGEQSFGDFQLHITPGGRGRAVGDEFRKVTGLDPTDPKNEKAMDLFALQHAAQYGWGDFHGAANTGIGAWQGIGARSAAAARNVNNNTRSSTSTSSSEVNIGNININAPNATDSEGIAGTIGPAMKRSAITSPANSGLN
jgi:hypothetical protein